MAHDDNTLADGPFTEEEMAALRACAPDGLATDTDGLALPPEMPVSSVPERLWIRGLVQPLAMYHGGQYMLMIQRSWRGTQLLRDMTEGGGNEN